MESRKLTRGWTADPFYDIGHVFFSCNPSVVIDATRQANLLEFSQRWMWIINFCKIIWGCVLTLSHRSYPDPFQRSSVRGRVLAREDLIHSSNSHQEAWSAGSGVLQRVCRTWKIRGDRFWNERRNSVPISKLSSAMLYSTASWKHFKKTRREISGKISTNRTVSGNFFFAATFTHSFKILKFWYQIWKQRPENTRIRWFVHIFELSSQKMSSNSFGLTLFLFVHEFSLTWSVEWSLQLVRTYSFPRGSLKTALETFLISEEANRKDSLENKCNSATLIISGSLIRTGG